MEACGYRPRSLVTPATIPVSPAMAFCLHPQLLPISLCSVSLSPNPTLLPQPARSSALRRTNDLVLELVSAFFFFFQTQPR